MHRCFQICESDIFTLYSHLLESQSSNQGLLETEYMRKYYISIYLSCIFFLND